MVKVTIAIASAFLFALAIGFAGPIISYSVNGQNIVSTPESAASYVGTAVGFIGAIASASVAFLAYELRKQDEFTAEDERRAREREHNTRMAALFVKARLRAIMKPMLMVIIEAEKIVGSDQLVQLYDNKVKVDDIFASASQPQLLELANEWKAMDFEFVIDPSSADSLAHLDNELLHDLLHVQAGWEECRLSSTATDFTKPIAKRRSGVMVQNIMYALNSLLRVNHVLNVLIALNQSDTPQVSSVKKWLEDTDVLPM